MNVWFLPAAVVGVWVAFIVFSAVQCSNIGKTAAEHEMDILDICQAVDLSDYTACLRREWDRVNDIPEYAKKR